MWELDHKESWVPKNWYSWTVMLEKTLESPLDCKEIQPVHPKEHQSWIFFGRTDAEAETPNTLATWCKELMLLNCGVGEDSWVSLGLQGDPTSQSHRKSVLGVHWKDWCWSWNSSTLATWCEELTHLKRPWCWERLKAGEEGDDRGWVGWMASLTPWTWVWASSGIWWWTGKPGVLWFMESQRVGHDWATELNWTELNWKTPPENY